MKSYAIYSKNKKPTNLTYVDGYLYSGKQVVAFNHNEKLYNFNGDLVGFIKNDCLFDSVGFLLGKMKETVLKEPFSTDDIPSRPGFDPERPVPDLSKKWSQFNASRIFFS